MEKQGCSLPTEGRCPTKPFPTCTASLGKGHTGTPHPSVHKDKFKEQLGLEQATAKLQIGKTSTTPWSYENKISPTGPEAVGAQLCPPQPCLCMRHSRLETRTLLEMTIPMLREETMPPKERRLSRTGVSSTCPADACGHQGRKSGGGGGG